MYFKRLEMHGFKSFAEPVVIEFHEGVTAIVGPNGSGKSNISDAIRWVLGEQSPKALRGGKMEEVIFAGTASRKSRGMAEVTLVIDNSTGILDIDYNEVAITRRMYRSGDSEYLINNNQCRLRDIRELIMDTGIGVDGYSLIGQGKIADIVSNKPESRREIFEEAAGVVLYKSKKAEAERKLASTAGNLDRVEDIVNEIESRIDTLKEDSEKATEYLALKDRYRDLEINITLKNVDSIVERNQEYKNDIANLEKEISSISENKKKVDRQIEEDRERSENLETLRNEAGDKLLKVVEEINIHTSRSQLNEERLAVIEKDKTRLNREISELSGKLKREQANAEELEKSKRDIAERFQEASDELLSRTEEHSKLSLEASQLSDAIDNDRSNLFQLHNTISSKKSEIKSYDSIKETLNKRKEQLGNDAEGAKKHSEENIRLLNDAKNQWNSLAAHIEETNRKYEGLSDEEQELIGVRKELRLTIEDLKLQGGQKAARKKTIEEMENNYEGYNYAVKFIMKSQLSGIEGVVAELMNVPQGYEVAIETALGGQMQNIVCNTDNDAKKAVNALKSSRAGRLTFLPISSIKGNKAVVDSRITGDSGYVGLASECIECDGKYRNVFQYLLGRVAITRDMDSAVRLSKLSNSGLRFVTFDGEIINASGAITGGQYKNKTANLLERKSEITKLEQEITQLRDQIDEAVSQVKASDDRLNVIEGEKKQLDEYKRDTEIQMAGLSSTINALSETVDSIDSNREKYTRELASIDRDLDAAEKAVDDLNADIEKANSQIEALNNRLEQEMSDYEEKKSEVNLASEEITNTRIAATEWENKLSNMETLLNRINESVEDYTFQIEDRKHQFDILEDEQDKIYFGSEGSENTIRELMEEKEATEAYIDKVAAERAELIDNLSTISREQQLSADKLNSCQDQKYQLEIKVAKNETQLDTMKERLWEDFEISYAQAQDFRKEDFVMSTSVKESREIRNRMRELGDVNVGAIKEYASVSERYRFVTEQRDDIVTAMDELKKIIADMDNTIKTKFKENFDQVVENFEEIFKELFGGGYAELRMEDENNPLESGIDIVAQPPGKKLQNINLMSGGEKTMTAIALMFAVLKTKPTPFCILDEVEAALDDANIDRFSNYLRKFDGIQFALVTHQKATMEHADVLYGVTMPEQGVSKVLSLRLGDDFEL
ncbi:MAG: chromosome segregation protein SMC [Eubacteriaceae bacterium]|nr:chromosome segregation protein SMC [Eubacteriaceae bacterium]